MTDIYVQANTVLGVCVFSGWTDKQTINFVDDEAKVTSLELIEGYMGCSNDWCAGTEFREEKGGILMCVNCGNDQMKLYGDSQYDSYKTGCFARINYKATLPESDER